MVASDYQLRASDGSRTIDSDRLRGRRSARVAQLVFTTSTRRSSTAGSRLLDSQPVVAADDAGGNVVTSYAGTVALSIRSGAGGRDAERLRELAQKRRHDVQRLQARQERQLRAARERRLDSPATARASPSTRAPSPRSPSRRSRSGAVVEQRLHDAPVVTAFDALGNVATSYGGTVTLSIKSGTGTPARTLSNCSVSREQRRRHVHAAAESAEAARGYVLRASDGTRTADSTAFNVR